MKKLGILSLVYVATAFLGLGARPASALPCCSACDARPESPACKHGCSPSCAIDDDTTEPDSSVLYDDDAGVCYVAPAGDSNGEAPAVPALN